MPTQSRLIALVGVMTHERRAAPTSGFPLEPEKMLPVADVVLVVPDGEDGAMLFRYTAHGEFGGDTPHATLGEALEQATFEYDDARKGTTSTVLKFQADRIRAHHRQTLATQLEDLMVTTAPFSTISVASDLETALSTHRWFEVGSGKIPFVRRTTRQI